MTRWLMAALVALIAAPATGQRAPHPLFADQQIIRLTITGPLRDERGDVARRPAAALRAQPATGSATS